MPLVSLEAPELTSRLDLPATPVTADEDAANETGRPAFGSTIAAAFQTQNEIGSWLAREDIPNPDEKEEGFSVFDYNRGTRYEQNENAFLDVFNSRAADAMRRQIDRDYADRATLQASGLVGTIAEIGAGIASPTTLLPGGAIVKGVRGGYAVGRTALTTSAAAVASVGAQEAALQSTEETRTGAETAIALGASALLGGFIGGGAAAVLTKVERQAAEKAVKSLTAQSGSPFGASGGAAAVSDIGVGDLDIAGMAAGGIANATSALNPNLRLNTSPAQSARLFGQQLAENSLYQAGNDMGVTAGPAVERLAQQNFNARIYRAEKALDEQYKAMRKAGVSMKRVDFENAVGAAARRRDAGENEFITRSAETYRREILDPFKDEAVSVGLLDEGVRTTTADSYLHRMWDFQKLTRGETEFKSIVRQWVANTVSEIPDGAKTDVFYDSIDDYADEVTNLVYDKLTGRANQGSTKGMSITMGPRGPLKERTFDIPDVLVEKFLNNNIVEVGRRYSRLMSAEVELTRKFGRVDMQEQIAKIADDFRNLRDQIGKAGSLDEIREITGKGFTFDRALEKAGKGRAIDKQREAALSYLTSREQSDIGDIEGLRDLVRGTYGIENANGAWARISRAASQINYIRLMGGVLIASIGDVYRPAMVHGLGPFMREGIAPLLTSAGRAARGMAVEEAQRFGLVVERYTQGRLATFAEIGDPYRDGTAVERLLENATRIGSRWNGILLWTDAMKSISSVMSQNRIVRGLKGEGDDRFLAYLGINPAMKARMAEQIKAHAEEIDGVWVAHTDRWTGPTAFEDARHFGAALGKDVDSIIVTRSVGDVPLFANTPTGRVLLQFKSFMLASHQKVLLRGLQESPTRFISGMMGMTTLGMLAGYVRAWRGGEKRFEKFEAAAQNPGYLVSEGLDLSGIFAVPFEAANMAEKIVGTNPIKDPLKALFPEANQQGSSLRYATRGPAATILGPTGGLIDLASEVSQLAAAAAQGEATEGQKKKLNRKLVEMVPFYSYPGAREMINLMQVGQ